MQPERKLSEPEVSPAKARRLQTGVRSMIVLVGCCGVVFWAARHLWESLHPALIAADGLTAGSAVERVNAARLIVQVSIKDSGVAIPALIAALEDPAPDVRVAAADALRPIASDATVASTAPDAVQAAITALIRSLEDSQTDVRIAAANALASIARSAGIGQTLGSISSLKTPSGVIDYKAPPAALIALLSDSSPKARAAAISTLAQFQIWLDPWLPFLIQSLEQLEPDLRHASASAMLRQKPSAFSPAAIPELIAALGSNTRTVRFHAAFALQPHVRNPIAVTAIPALVALLREPAYPDLGKLAISEKYQNDPTEIAAALLGEIAPGTACADEVIAALTDVVRSGHRSRMMRAVWSLEKHSAAEPAIPALIGLMREISATPGRSALVSALPSALGRIAPLTASAATSVSALTEAALHSESSELRANSIKELPRFGRDAAIAIPLLRALQNDPNPIVSAAAAAAMTSLELAK